MFTRTIGIVLGVLFSLAACAQTGQQTGQGNQPTANDQQRLVERATLTANAITADPDFTTLRRMLPQARAVFIAPQVLKGSFIVGGQGGSGVMMAKNAQGQWNGPAFYTLGAGSVGLQLGAEVSEIMLVVMSDQALQALLRNQLVLGADVSVAAGPIGRGADVSTTTEWNADIYTFSRAVGLSAGVSLEGAVIAPRPEWNQQYYNAQNLTPRSILLEGEGRAPGRASDELKQALRRAAEPR